MSCCSLAIIGSDIMSLRYLWVGATDSWCAIIDFYLESFHNLLEVKETCSGSTMAPSLIYCT